MLADASTAKRVTLTTRMKVAAAVSLIAIIALGIMLVLALDIVIPRLAFPFLDQSISDTWLAMPWIALTAGVCLLWRRKKRKLADRCATALVAIVPAYLLGILATHALNAVGDKGTPRTAAYEVVGFTYGRSSTYAHLDPLAGGPQWPPLEVYIDLLTPKPDVGDVVVVRVRPGRLGYAWVEEYGIPSRIGTR